MKKLHLIGKELKNKNTIVYKDLSNLQGLIDKKIFTKSEVLNQVSKGVNNNFETICNKYELSELELEILSNLADKHLITINSKFK